MNPLVSIVIPVHNAGAFLEATIESVHLQTYKNIELIIVDNCSTEKETTEVLARLSKKHYIVQSTIPGLSQARNDGIAVANGMFILPLDADDIIKPSFVSACVDLFLNEPDLTIVRTHIEFFGAKNGKIMFEDFTFSKLLARNMMVATSMFKKLDWTRVGGYDTSFTTCFEDWEFWISLLKNGGKVGTVKETLFRYRIRKDSMIHSLKMDNLRRARKRIWEKHRKEYGKYFVDPVESFEYKFIADSKANKIGNLLLKPFSIFKVMK